MIKSSKPKDTRQEKPAMSGAELNAKWAADRTHWAADRTFIAWLRTSISMIGFGISIGKAGDVLEQQGFVVGPSHATQYLGVTFILLAALGLIAALFQNARIARRLAREGYPRVEPTPLAMVMGVLVILFGFAGVLFIFY